MKQLIRKFTIVAAPILASMTNTAYIELGKLAYKLFRGPFMVAC